MLGVTMGVTSSIFGNRILGNLKTRFDQIQTGCYLKLKGNIALLFRTSNSTSMELFFGFAKWKASSSLKESYPFPLVHYIMLIVEEKTHMPLMRAI